MIIFDCDGVLVDSEVVYIDAELQFLARVGIRYPRAAYVRRFMGRAPRDWRRDLAADAVARTGAALPAGFFDDLDAFVLEALEDRLTAVPGARDAVAGVGHPRCVASSTAQPRLSWKLRRAGLGDLFGSHVYSADLVRRGKPAPDLFLHAARAMGADPASTVVVEDSVNGVLAGRSAGMAVIGFTGGGHCPADHATTLAAAGADAVVGAFVDLADAIAGLGGTSRQR